MEIHGLDHLINLKALDLKCNQITEIQGLNHLVNLKTDVLGYIICPDCQKDCLQIRKYLFKLGSLPKEIKTFILNFLFRVTK
jgi:hypothetical protein